MPDTMKCDPCISVQGFKGKILSRERQGRVRDEWLKIRFSRVLPKLMEREGFDMWIVAAREDNNDPVMLTMLPSSMWGARRLTILVFFRRESGEVEALSLSRYPIGNLGLFSRVWKHEEEGQWEALRRVVEERSPNRIGINESATFSEADGLSSVLRQMLNDALGPELASRLESAERLCVGWLEERIEEELVAYPALVAMTHAIIAEAFSDRVIHPGITTCSDITRWMTHAMYDLGVREAWTDGQVTDVDIEAEGQTSPGADEDKTGRRERVMPGDIVHCDIGFRYLGLWTDVQRSLYVLRPGECDAPEGLRAVMAEGNRLQDIVAECLALGRTGNQVLQLARERAIAEGITPRIYCHPIGVHCHAAGPPIGLWDQQDGVPGSGEYEFRDRTCYSIELNVRKAVPEWGGQIVRIRLEEDAMFVDGKLQWLSGRQTRFHLV